uniref:Uncharacterized protein n=1 Tax=Eutreptiella gymnastica TaxID=73025 RepID=A0A7S4LFS1_9EUGL
MLFSPHGRLKTTKSSRCHGLTAVHRCLPRGAMTNPCVKLGRTIPEHPKMGQSKTMDIRAGRGAERLMRGQQGRNIFVLSHGTSRESCASGKAAKTLNSTLFDRRPRVDRNLATNILHFMTVPQPPQPWQSPTA